MTDVGGPAVPVLGVLLQRLEQQLSPGEVFRVMGLIKSMCKLFWVSPPPPTSAPPLLTIELAHTTFCAGARRCASRFAIEREGLSELRRRIGGELEEDWKGWSGGGWKGRVFNTTRVLTTLRSGYPQLLASDLQRAEAELEAIRQAAISGPSTHPAPRVAGESSIANPAFISNLGLLQLPALIVYDRLQHRRRVLNALCMYMCAYIISPSRGAPCCVCSRQSARPGKAPPQTRHAVSRRHHGALHRRQELEGEVPPCVVGSLGTPACRW